MVFFCFSGAEASLLKLGRGDGYPVNILKAAELYLEVEVLKVDVHSNIFGNKKQTGRHSGSRL